MVKIAILSHGLIHNTKVILSQFPIKKPWNGCFRAMRKAALGDLYVKFSFRVSLDNNGIVSGCLNSWISKSI